MEIESGLSLERTGVRAHCASCRRETLFIHIKIANERHLLLTILTGGLWGIVWISLFVGKSLRPWRCRVCGWHKPEFRVARKVPFD